MSKCHHKGFIVNLMTKQNDFPQINLTCRVALNFMDLFWKIIQSTNSQINVNKRKLKFGEEAKSNEKSIKLFITKEMVT